MRTARQIADRVSVLRQRNTRRDRDYMRLIAMRRGDYESVVPGLFGNAEFDKPFVANLIDTTARDLAEVMAPMPTVTCNSPTLSVKAEMDRQDKRTWIANSYVQHSRLQSQRFGGADRFNSFGFMAYVVEPDYDDQTPVIRISDVPTAHYTRDFRGRTKEYFEVFKAPVEKIKADHPEYAEAIERKFPKHASEDRWCEVVKFYDEDCCALVLLDPCITLAYVKNRIGRCPVKIVERPKLIDDPAKGQFDDVIWVQVARAITQSQTFEAIDKAINAPLAVPKDVQEVEIGPETVVQSDQPQNIGRVRLDIPTQLFPEQQILAQEQRTGSRYPEGRSGNIDASIVTGQGVQALMGTFDTQIQTWHRLDASVLEDVLEICFRMDEAYFGDASKTVHIKDNGDPREVTYTPSKDIAGNYITDVSYGAIAGLDPNRALVFILQAIAGGIISMDTARKYLPVDINPSAEGRSIDLEKMNLSMAEALSQLPLALPQMAMMGQDPRDVVLQFAKVQELMQKGKSPAEAAKEVFAPKEEEQPAVDPMQAAMEQAAAGQPAALPGQGQGGASDLLMSLAGMTPGGDPNMQSNVSRRQAI